MAELPAPRPLPLVFRRPQIARHHEVLGLWLQVLWLPLALLGAMLVLSLEGANFGLPLMLLSLPPFLAGRMRHRGGRAPRSLVAAGFLATVFVGATWGYFLVQDILSFADWRKAIQLSDVLGMVTLLLWAGGAFAAVVQAWRRPSFDRERS